MDTLAKVNRINLVSSLSPNVFRFTQNGRGCLFIRNLSDEFIIEDLQDNDEINVIVITNCRIDTSKLSMKTLESLEMLFITECRMDFLPLVENLSNLTYLDLSFNSLSYFPSDIGSLRKLKVLKLSGNRITNIPSEIVYLEFLQVLDLSHNMISHLPRKLFSLRSLIHFDCSSNTLFRLPDNISELLYLEALFLSGNVLTTLPTNFSLLKRLQRLNLSGNRFEYIPFCIFQCFSLKELLFSYNQASGFVPDNLCRLGDLEILSLAFNKFTKLPGKLSNLSKLKFFDIKGNNIGRIPEEIFGKCKNLRHVNCGSCELIEVPPSLGLCTNLRVLDLSGNMLKKLPSEGKALKNLISLFLKNNKISVLPQWVCDLEHVITINVCGNLLQDFPNGFSNVAERLRMINISYNEFEVVPSCLFSTNSKLTYFLMDHNPVLQIPPEICNLKLLTHLSISHCPYIFELPDELGGLLKLRTLRLCDNSLLKLPRTMHRLENLNYLDLSDNKFSCFPIVVCYIPHLKVLLYNNCCHTCTYLESDPPGWFDRTDLIDPDASMEKLGKDYIDEVESFAAEDERPPTLEEALEFEKEAAKIPKIKHDEISNLVFKRKPHKIPRHIYCLKFLVHLSLQNNGLYFLPNVFDRFKHLKRIYLNDNNLRKIPSSIAACKTLTDIDLRNNKLSEIHGELHRLSNLKNLELDGNNFPLCLREVIKHSDLKGLCAYLDALNQNRDFILRRMCERFIGLVSQDDWAQILQRLGVSEDTLEHIEDELPGGYNFRRRVTRALEYWSGMDLSTRVTNFEIQSPGALNTEALTTSAAAIVNTTVTTNTTPSFEDEENLSEERSQAPAPKPSTMLVGTEAEISILQPITLTFAPLVSGPKATPARLIHVLTLLDKKELVNAMTEIVEKFHVHQI